MLHVKVAVTAAVLAGLAGWLGHVPPAIIDAAAFCGATGYLTVKASRSIADAARLFRRALTTYELLKELPATLGELKARLQALEQATGEIKEPVEAIKREVGATARGDTPHPTPDA